MARQPYAYRRKSRVFRDKATISPEMQLDEIRALAARHGDTELVLLDDMNISGRRARKARPGFNQLLEAVDAGEVSAIYSYSLSRLSRSVKDIVDLAEKCAAAGVPIRLAVDPDPDPTSPSGKMILTILAAMAQFEADVASERNKDAAEARRSRGEKLGPSFFADTEAVVKAYEEAGSYFGAAQLLTLRGIPTRNGNRVWAHTSVKTILLRAAPDSLPPTAQRAQGAKAAAPFLFYRLVRCHCGTILTGIRDRAGRYTRYMCMRGRHDPAHGRSSVTERVIEEWARREAALLLLPKAAIELAGDGAQRDALQASMTRLGRAYVDGTISEVEYEAVRAQLSRDLATLDAQGRTVALKPIDWSRDIVATNQVLRAIWTHVQLGPDLRPSYAAWALPAWRAPIPEAARAPG